jgi:hypothetical protein
LQVRPGGVEGGRVAGRSGSQDDDAALFDHGRVSILP